MNYWKRILLYSSVPAVGFHLLLTPFWFLESFQASAKATSIEMAFDILLPIYLLKSHYNNSEEFVQFRNYPVNALIILLCVSLSCLLHYANWALAVGDFLHPDNETLTFTLFEFAISLTIAIVGIAITFIVIRNKRQQYSQQ